MTRRDWERRRYELYQDLKYRMEDNWRGSSGEISFSAILKHLNKELPASLISDPKCPYCSWNGDNRGRHGHIWAVHGVIE